ncbi:hypothetical protein BaRGS_00029169 [Batillaria attramentaria]|uniref:Ig-like domain-containing protein n=1 Tax=Batillaria attramentaria TaxID=370345 RepID=A0ABD0JYH2_9CAEN
MLYAIGSASHLHVPTENEVKSENMDTCMVCLSIPGFEKPAYLGEPGTLNCYFDVDATTLDPRPSFNVSRADNEDFDYNRDTVLDCDWIGKEQLCMTIKDGYRFDGRISNKLTIIMDNVTQEQAGQYYCQLVHSSGAGDIERCTLNVTGKLEAKEGGLGLPLIIAIPVIIVVLLVAVVILVYMFRRRLIPQCARLSRHVGIQKKASEHGDNGSKSKKDLEEGLSDTEDVFPVDTTQPNVNSTVNEPLLSNSPADDETPADDERQELSAENDDGSGYV